MLPRSNSLFHFTKSIDVLESILLNGFWPRYCAEDVKWHGRRDNEFIAFPMVCFCDIPISRIDEHVGFYGSYGLGMTREWAEKNVLNPVMYFSGKTPLLDAVNANASRLFKLPEDLKEPALKDHRYFLAHSKPTRGAMLISGKREEKDFYQESEWRYVPTGEGVTEYLKEAQFGDDKKLENYNQATRKSSLLKFSPADVRYIFVPRDSDIPRIVTFIQSELDGYPAVELKVLMSRVTSLESLAADV